MESILAPHRIASHRIGVIGGGQLAWMLGQAAQTLGFPLWIQTPDPTDPAVAIATGTIFAPIADAQATAQLAQQCDVITFENEFVDLAALQTLVGAGVQFAPRLDNLRPLLDKYDQRCYFQTIALPTPEFSLLTRNGAGQLNNPWGFPVVLKMRRQGYDGQGTYIIHDGEDLEKAVKNQPLDRFLLEEFVPFDRELAVMVARSSQGEIAIYPVVETQQEDQVCRRVIAPAPVDLAIQQAAQKIAQTFIEAIEGVGIFGLEFFLTQDDRLLINEVAPRTHNSGHYTLEACYTSQFEQQIRAICNLSLGCPDLKYTSAVMINLLGYESAHHTYECQRQALAQIPQASLYWYNKPQARPGRKMGHLTIVFDEKSDRLDLKTINQVVERIWTRH